jgi:hypothetical protein
VRETVYDGSCFDANGSASPSAKTARAAADELPSPEQLWWYKATDPPEVTAARCYGERPLRAREWRSWTNGTDARRPARARDCEARFVAPLPVYAGK